MKRNVKKTLSKIAIFFRKRKSVSVDHLDIASIQSTFKMADGSAAFTGTTTDGARLIGYVKGTVLEGDHPAFVQACDDFALCKSSDEAADFIDFHPEVNFHLYYSDTRFTTNHKRACGLFAF